MSGTCFLLLLDISFATQSVNTTSRSRRLRLRLGKAHHVAPVLLSRSHDGRGNGGLRGLSVTLQNACPACGAGALACDSSAPPGQAEGRDAFHGLRSAPGASLHPWLHSAAPSGRRTRRTEGIALFHGYAAPRGLRSTRGYIPPPRWGEKRRPEAGWAKSQVLSLGCAEGYNPQPRSAGRADLWPACTHTPGFAAR
jgi:hypothetical protein